MGQILWGDAFLLLNKERGLLEVCSLIQILGIFDCVDYLAVNIPRYCILCATQEPGKSTHTPFLTKEYF